MLYLLDANVLISAHELHYPLDRIPQFWAWLLMKSKEGKVKIPFEIYSEIINSKGILRNWLSLTDHIKFLKLDAQVDIKVLQNVISEGYAPDLTDSELEQIGQDAFLIAYAIPLGTNATVVTREVAKPAKKRQNRKVPDVCRYFNVRCITDFQFFQELDFRISS